MKISIAMATYNGAKYIREQLDSFVKQTRQPDEVVISDDYSRDETINIVEDFAATAPFEVKIYHNETNLGVAQNFNNALQKTTGDLIFLSDQDDVWFSEKIRALENIAQENSSYLFFVHDGELIDENGYSVGLTKLSQKKLSGVIEISFNTGCCAAVRRELLEIGLPIPYEIKSHDIWLGKLAESMECKYLTPYIYQYIRRHSSNVSTGLDKRMKKNNKLISFYYKLLFSMKNIYQNKEAINKRINCTQMMLQKIKHAKKDLKYSNFFELDRSIEYLNNELNIFQRRHSIKSKSRLFRVFPVFGLWFQGGYNKFSGINSAIRDIVFP